MTVQDLSKAHQLSATAVIDPAYSVFRTVPETAAPADWLYPRAEYECFLLQQMRKAVVLLKLNVGYPGVFHTPVPAVFFRRNAEAGTLNFRANGTVSATLNGSPLETVKDKAGNCTLTLPEAGQLLLKISVNSTENMLPALLPELAEGWEASIDGSHYEPACSGGDPFGEKFPSVRMTPVEYAPGRYDFGRELLARVRISSVQKPNFGVGESKFEVENSSAQLSEQSLELIETSSGTWETPLPLAFRYIRAEAENPVHVECDAEFTPVRYAGAFASDTELTRIWMNSAYTLRLCMRHFLIDGVKRDRLPWAGDLALSLLANAYTFASPEPVRRTLTVLGRAGIREKHVNDVTDYSLWMLISHDLFQRYFNDPAFLARQYPEIRDMTETLLEQAGDSFLPHARWVFVDWVNSQLDPARSWDEEEKQVTLQVHFFWALNSAAALAGRMNDDTLAGRCRAKAAQIRTELLSRAIDSATWLFRANCEHPEYGTFRHTNFYAVLSGLVEGEQARQIMERLLNSGLPPVGTPYQAALEILALIRTGFAAEALAEIRRIWGGMLKLGATTFFEAYDESLKGNDIYAFYNRPYALSLCHAWSAGPAALLPILLFGAEPAADGWRTFRLSPSPLLRNGDTATIPTPHGEIELWMEDGELKKKLPEGIELL